MKILIIGLGSIGRKHYDNLKLLGYNDIDIADPIYPDAKYKDIYEVGFNNGRYDLVIICTPSDDHLEHVHCLNDRGFPYIMCEKPLYVYPTGSQLMLEANLPVTIRELKSQVYVNNAYRFARTLQKLKECIPMVGELWQASLENQYSFDKLHPTYTDEERKHYHILYDDVHIINVSRFLFGEPKEIVGKAIRWDFSQWLWKTEGGVLVAHKTHVLDQRYKKRIEISGSEGTLIWNWSAHEIFFCPKDKSERIAIPAKHCCHLTESLKYVIGVVGAKGEFTENTIGEAIKDVQIVEELLK